MSQKAFKVSRRGTYQGNLGRKLFFQVTLKGDHEIEVEVVGNDRLVRGLKGELARVSGPSAIPLNGESVNFATRKAVLEIFGDGNFVISPGSYFGTKEIRLWVTIAVGKRPSTRKVVTIVLRYKNDPDPRLTIAKRK